MTTSKNETLFLQLVRLGIGLPTRVTLEPNTDWLSIGIIAEKHGLLAILIDAISLLKEKNKHEKQDWLLPDQEILLQWIGQVMQEYEYNYESYIRTLAEMADFYNSRGYKTMVLKGYACGLNWPRPEHRPYGDIDIWQFGKYKDADALVAQEKRIKVDKSHHHHTVFCWNDYTVENHYDFINIYHHKTNAALEKEFKKLGQDDYNTVEVYGKKLYLPSPNLHALFLLKHCLAHFASSNINLRQVLDWAFFVKANTTKIDWSWFSEMLERYHMRDFCNILNAICVEDLGFDYAIFKEVRYIPSIKDKVLADILNPKYEMAEPESFFPRVAYKIKRWRGNAWKLNLCYGESQWEALLSGIWNHLLKPSSI